MNINTNLSSLITQSSLKTSTLKLNQAIERMTTGCKINHAKDNAANYSISTNLSTKIGAYQVAQDNALMGLDMVQTTSSALSTMSDLTSRLRSLAMQAKNGTYGDKSISAINQEAASIINELYRIKSTTEYNGIKLFDSTPDPSNGVTLPDGTVLKPNSKGFLKDIVERDTSMMTALASVDENTALTSGVYSISTAEELAKLASMTNSGKIGANTEFVLAEDIDLVGYDNWTPIGKWANEFKSTFDGNGHKITNLKCSSFEIAGLFGYAENGSTIKNLGIIAPDVSTSDIWAGALAGRAENVENCYSIGGTSSAGVCDAGGLIGVLAHDSSTGKVSYCYSTTEVISFGNQAGGLIGYAGADALITNSFAAGDVIVNYLQKDGGPYEKATAGGLIGNAHENCTIKNSAALGNVTFGSNSGMICGGNYPINFSMTIENCVYNTGDGSLNATVTENALLTDVLGVDLNKNKRTSFQVGVNSAESSQIEYSRAFLDTSALNYLSIYGLDSERAIDAIDSLLEFMDKKQTEYGGVENRLTSVLEQISIQYENLVSSRSTIQDADIADVSSEYIRQQILQQASATLMATANQSPAIALQLL